MANDTTFYFHKDGTLGDAYSEDLTDPKTSTFAFTGGTEDFVVYLGSVAASTVLRADSDPGVDPIIVSIADDNGAGGDAATEIKLALSSGGLASAVAGAALEIGTQVLSGTGNAIAIHVRRTSPAGAVGTQSDLSLLLNACREDPV